MSTADEINMKKTHADKVNEAVNHIIERMFGDSVEVHVVQLGEPDEDRKAHIDRLRLNAITTVEARLVVLREIVEKWQEMLVYLVMPLDDRKPAQVLEEMALARQIHDLYERLEKI